MISTQIIQNSIDELKAITKVDLCVYDLEGNRIAGTDEMQDVSVNLISGFGQSPADSQVIGAHHLLKIMDEGEPIYVLVARGFGDDVYMVGKIAVSQLQNLIVAYKERFDRNNFFQNLILDNLLLVDIYNRAKKLHIEAVGRRAVFLVETATEKDGMVTEDAEPMNDVTIEGPLCREPIYRRTPLGREICDAMIAVPRAFSRADYLPCILWGRTAQEVSRCHTRDRVRITGRLQSRVYTKLTESGPVERIAYEISALSAEVLDDVL